MNALRLVAGSRALAHLREHGLRQQDFDVMVGASGGPKWFALYGLDQYLMGEFFKQRTTPLHLLGSSAGAWRFSCFAQKDPIAASKRFAEAYHSITFAADANIHHITDGSRSILDAAIPTPQHAQEIIDNPIFKLNLIVARARRLTSSRNRLLLAASLGVTATANAVHRKALGAFFERVLFHSANERPPFYDVNDLPTHRVALTQDNLRDAIMASGSIPMALHGVEDIDGAGPGLYYDGGVTDYHFDIPFGNDGLVLYPHFYPTITPGWFDKAIKWRKANSKNYENVLILCPSDEWVKSLPFGKIPDRKDFANMDDTTRIKYWRTTLDRSAELADELRELASGQRDITSYLPN
ncbi:MAG: patatin-like phospholipase family protein [Alcanivoracaceae bacterium]|nr:patatin-like phospholipase family protein [Alcanivoracaceae bacterium]